MPPFRSLITRHIEGMLSHSPAQEAPTLTRLRTARAGGSVRAMTVKEACAGAGAFGLALLAGAALIPGPSAAANGNPGRAAYFKYCSSCHGDDGRGNGPAGGGMRPRPADLTHLAKRHGGTFPYAEVKEIIDGRKRLDAHGSSKMPVWGKVFAQEQTYMPPEAHAQSQIELITNYLASIQTN
jgi:mono/diheme cytochrome c family protein